MTEQEIAHTALEALKKHKIQGEWLPAKGRVLDGKVRFKIDNRTFTYNVEIRQEMRNFLIPKILEQNRRNAPYLLLAGRIFPKIKEELRDNKIAYLEGNGDFFLRQDDLYILIDTKHPPLRLKNDKRTQAFTKTGIKVLFEFLQNPGLINRTYRDIAEHTKAATGTLTNVVEGLIQEKVVVPVNDKTLIFKDRREAIEKWADAFDRWLKPALHVGTFRFVTPDWFFNWKNIRLKEGKTWWGGEPAGDILTNNLRPASLTLYTTEPRFELMNNYRLIPDENGNVQVYDKFWVTGVAIPNAVPPLLAYADLFNTHDPRCGQIAEEIYERYLKADIR
ncbi:MAG: hypothetical protein JNL40_02100 [Cyclobacteriaceae bacterium]|nr:hypothetical protein [Cyclobacteriaceae bacterium]